MNIVDTTATFDDHLYRLIDSAKCTISINVGFNGDGKRFTVLRNFIPMCRGVAVVAERTPDMWDAGWAPVIADEANFPEVVMSVVSHYKEFAISQREMIMQFPYSDIIRAALEAS